MFADDVHLGNCRAACEECPIDRLLPATSGDTFGAKYATTHNGMLYTAKGTAVLLVPLASIISSQLGWQAVFIVAVALNATAALTALLLIKPMRRAFILGSEATASAAIARAKVFPDDASVSYDRLEKAP